MKTPFPDWLVLTTILLTLLVVFALAFGLRPSDPDGPPLLWRTTPPERGDSLQI